MPTASTEHTRIRGEVERVFYSSASFSAGRFITDGGDRIKFAGNVVVQESQPLVLHGRFVRHPKYGSQFEVTSMEFDRHLDARGLANYLANNPDIKGIGPAKARIIAERFGGDFERSLLEEADRIAEVARVPISVIEAMRGHWLETSSINSAMTVLSAYGLTHHQVTMLVKKLGNNAVAIIERNPYTIVGEIDDFGFKRIDKIARQVGVPKDAPGRIRAGIVFCVEDALDSGDCWVEYEDLLDRANALLVMDNLDSRQMIESELDYLIDGGHLTCYPADSRFLVAKPWIERMESDLSRVLNVSDRINPCFPPRYVPDVNPEVIPLHEALFETLVRQHPSIKQSQLDAVLNATRYGIFLICGGAGSGKTFTISALTDLAESHGLNVTLAAPTGKAAKRLEEATGRSAMTVHRLLGFNGTEFTRNAENPLGAGVLIIDEVSMMDVSLAWRLFNAVDLSQTAVVLVGDHNQLPPVGPGNILRDIINSSAVPKIILDEVVRQAGVLKENSIAILKGEVRKSAEPEPDGRRAWYVADQHSEPQQIQSFLLGLFEKVLSEKLGFDILSDVQVLTPTHKSPLGTSELNILLQRLVQKKLWNFDVPLPTPGMRPKFYANDKVIQTRNNYTTGIMNGSMGIVRHAGSDGSLSVGFEDKVVNIQAGAADLRDIQLAYALTIHKAQGSEFPCSIVIAHKSHSFMHHRNLLYTGVTRATKTAIILGDRWGIANCAKHVQVDVRKTFLSLLLPCETYKALGGAA